MDIQFFSDTHNYDLSYQPKKTNADVLVCLGDWDMGLNSEKWDKQVLQEHEKPFIKILGNHDVWNDSRIDFTIEKWHKYYKSLEKNKNLFYLINETKVIDNVAFIGTTLWTDFNNYNLITVNASNISKDFSKIYEKYSVLIKPEYMYQMFLQAKEFIISELEKHSDKKCVVLTHFPPSIACSGYDITPVSHYWCGNMENVISRYQPALWLSGHMHISYDSMFGNTRVILNPAGKIKNGIWSNEHFVDGLIAGI